MSNLICNAPFCEKTRTKNYAWCPTHRWDRVKHNIKPFKQIPLFKILKPKYKPKYCPIKQKQYNAKSASRRQENRLIKRYGINNQDYDLLLEMQNRSCAICNVKSNKENWQNDKTQRFDVDHCHDTGKVRGLLCRRCNIFIGYIGKQVDLLPIITRYLRPK